MNVSIGPGSRFRHWCSFRYLRISPLHRKFHFPLPYSSHAVSTPFPFFTHAASLDQGFPHCPIFPTAASRRSPDRVSVPVWLVVLSDQLRIVALVGHYPTN